MESKIPVDTNIERMKVISQGKTEAAREFQSLEVIGINDLTNCLVLFVSNLTVKGCLMFENRVFRKNVALSRVDFISSEQNLWYKKGKERRRFYDCQRIE